MSYLLSQVETTFTPASVRFEKEIADAGLARQVKFATEIIFKRFEV